MGASAEVAGTFAAKVAVTSALGAAPQRRQAAMVLEVPEDALPATPRRCSDNRSAVGHG
jgi:hypothetical protein